MSWGNFNYICKKIIHWNNNVLNGILGLLKNVNQENAEQINGYKSRCVSINCGVRKTSYYYDTHILYSYRTYVFNVLYIV